MLDRKLLIWPEDKKYNSKIVIKRIEKINSLDMFKSKNNVVMKENYYYTFEELRLNKNYKHKKLFKLVNYVFYTDAIISYLTDYKEFQKFYSACKKVQNIIIKEKKLKEIKERKENVMNLFI